MTVAALMDIGAASLIIAWACLVVSSDWARGRARPRRAVPRRSRREARRAARATRRRLVIEQLEQWDKQYKAITEAGREPVWTDHFGWIEGGRSTTGVFLRVAEDLRHVPAGPVLPGVTSAAAARRLRRALRHAGGAW